MAKQNGIFKVEGTIGDMTFYKSKDGFMVRGKGSVSRDRIINNPSFKRTHENMEKFNRAGKAGKTLRLAFLHLLLQASDSRVVSRLTRKMYRVIKTNLTSSRDKRNILDGETELLQGFEFHEQGKRSATLLAPWHFRSN